MSFFSDLGLIGLFCISFLASTILPIGSEAALIYLKDSYPTHQILLIVTIGNSLGSFTSYWVGSLGNLQWCEKYLKVKHHDLLKWQKYIQQYGYVMAFLCWMPIVGDIFAVGLGYFKVSFKKVIIPITLGKFLRYYILLGGIDFLLSYS